MNLSYIVNMEKVLGKKQFSAKRNGALIPNSGQVTLLEIDQPCVLDRFEFSTNFSTGTYIRFFEKIDGVWVASVSVNFVSADGASTVGLISPDIIATTPNDVWKIMNYDTVNTKYSFALSRDLKFTEGLKITVENYRAYDINLAVVAIGRKY